MPAISAYAFSRHSRRQPSPFIANMDPTLLGLSATGWERVDVAGLLLLLIGTAIEARIEFGEWFEYFPTEKRLWERRALVLLLVGLGLELIATPMASYLNGKMLAEIAPRTLKTELVASSMATLRSVGPRLVNIEMPLGDSEAFRLTAQVADLLRSAGWTAHVAAMATSGKLVLGITVVVSEEADEADRHAAQVFLSTMREHELGAFGPVAAADAPQPTFGTSDIDPAAKLRIFVGSKPLQTDIKMLEIPWRPKY